MSTAAIVGATVGSSIIGAVGSNAAANTQAGAAEQAQALQAQEAQNALDFQKQQWTTEQQNAAPWLQAGTGAIGTLSNLQNAALVGQGPLANWTGQFTAPTAEQAAATPGYQFELGQGEQAIQRSAAASGDLLSGGTMKNLDLYANNVASTNYQQAYQNAQQQYTMGYNQFQNNQSNTFNRLAALSGLGQTAAGQLGTLGQSAAGNVSNISLTTGAQQGQSLQNAGAANASGYVGMSNALSGGLNNLSQLAMLQNMYGGNDQWASRNG